MTLQQQERKKILHVNNIAGVASALANEQRKRGHDVDIAVFDERVKYNFPGGAVYYNWRSVFEKLKFLKDVGNYDVVHYHYPYGSLKTMLEMKVNKKRQVYLKHYHGDDIRNKKDDSFCLVAVVDILPFAKNGVWVPNPIDIEEIDRINDYVSKYADDNKESSRIPRIAHYPYYRVQTKYEDHYSEALDKLTKSGKAEIVTISGLPHEKALEMLATCDIVVGKILPGIGWFGKFELEGMALGKPVVAYIGQELFRKYHPPVFMTNKDSLYEDLVRLIDDASLQRWLGMQGRRYIQDNHDVVKVVDTLDKFYSTVDERVN